MIINHVKQPTRNTCVSACLSMITGIDVNEVVAIFHKGYYEDKDLSLGDFLDGYGISFTQHYADNTEAVRVGGVYLVTVPSLNIVGMLHQIVVDARDPDNLRVLDPIQGWDGARYYVAPNQKISELEYPLTGFIIDYTVNVNA